jgi:hypothetical protein
VDDDEDGEVGDELDGELGELGDVGVLGSVLVGELDVFTPPHTTPLNVKFSGGA